MGTLQSLVQAERSRPGQENATRSCHGIPTDTRVAPAFVVGFDVTFLKRKLGMA